MNAPHEYPWGESLPTLPGDGVHLRALSEADLPALYEIFGDPEVMRYWSRPPFDSLEVTADFLGEIRSGFMQRQLFQWGIVERGASTVVGTCTLCGFDRDGWRCELGYALARRAWGRSLARRALTTVLDFAFTELGVHRVEADVDPRNERSLGLLERLGFVREGLLRQRYHVGGETQDSVVLGLLRGERPGQV